MLNSCILTGNLGADPEVFYSSEGDPVTSFNLAFRSSKKKTGWIKITCFNRQAEVAERYLHTSRELAEAEVELLYPTISMPVTIALFDLGPPNISDGEEETTDGTTSIPADDNGAVEETNQG